MLRACVLTYGTSWEESLPYAKFAYNNSYQASLQMAPFEALYGRRCCTTLNWSETGDSHIFGPDMRREAEEKVKLIRDRLRPLKVDRRVIMIRNIVGSASNPESSYT